MFGKSIKQTRPASREYVLHLGLHKTATTALQEFLSLNQRKLASMGVLYIHLKRMRAEITPLLCSSAKKSRHKLSDILQTFPHQKLLLSDENILGGPADIPLGMLYPLARHRILTFCEDVAPSKVTILLTLRSPATFLTSMYCEYIRHHDFLSFAEYVGCFDIANFRYSSVFPWLNDLPNNARCVVTPFEQNLGGGVQAITSRVLAETTNSTEDFDLSLFPSRLSRSSYSAEELDLAATISEKAGAKAAHVFLNALDARDMRFGKTKFEPVDRAIAQAIHACYEIELANYFKSP